MAGCGHDRSEPPTLRLADDAALVRRAFAEWHAHLLRQALPDGTAQYLPDAGLFFRELSGDGRLRLEFVIPGADSAAVQINEPRTAGSENPLGGIGVDPDDRRYILRQGVLHLKNASARIAGPAFLERTGLPTTDVRVGTAKARRQWHVVAPLGRTSDAAVAAATADFVARCWTARLWDGTARRDREQLDRLLGRPEAGGWYTIQRPSMLPRRVLRQQGEVWLAVRQQLAARGVALAKPRHARGYEVDAEILAPGGPLLVEIKTDVAAADLYAGVGQLLLYPQLMPRLAGHTKVLLLPGDPHPELERAIGAAGVAVHWYSLTRRGRRSLVAFDPRFLTRCGVVV